MTEYTRLPLRKEHILNIKIQAEQACAKYRKELGVGGNYWDQKLFTDAINNEPDLIQQLRTDIELKRLKYIDDFELSCICEMALLYLESITPVKEEK